MRQVTDGGEDVIVACGLERAHDAAARGPGVGYPLLRVGRRLSERGQDHRPAAKESIRCSRGAGALGARNRMPGYKTR